MRTRAARITAIVLAVAALALAAFIVLFEQHTLTSGELAGRKGRVLERFVRPRVTKLELQRGGRTIVMEREREAGEDDELGAWKITAPIHTKADADAVDALLGALEWLDARRSLEGVTAADRHRFGLDHPRARLWFTAGRDRVPLLLGSNDAGGEGTYIQLGDPTRAYVVPTDFPEALAHDLAHFRTKSLFAEASPLAATKISLHAGATAEIRLSRPALKWSLEAPIRGMASMPAVNELLRALDELHVERFVAERPGALARWGLDHPEREASLEIPLVEGEGQPRRIVRSHLRVGGACDGHPEERYAMVGDAGPVTCVLSSRLDGLAREPDRLRERRLVTVEPEDVTRIEIVVGSRRLEATRHDAKFRVTATRGGFDAPVDVVEAFVQELTAAQAEGFVGAAASDLAAHGLTTPAARITLRRESGAEETVALGNSDMTHAFARRGDEPAIVELASSVADLFDPSGVRFRDRTLVRENDDDCKRLVIARGAVREELTISGRDWSVTAPVQAPADGGTVNDLVRGIGSLAALRFVAERATTAHGLATPRVIATARFEGYAVQPGAPRGKDAGVRPQVRTYVLRVGADTEGGAFATLGDEPAVFVARAALVSALLAPALSRDALSTEESDLERIVIERGPTRIEIHKVGDAWENAAGGAANADRTRELVSAIASLRAQSVRGYGAALPADGMSAPTLRVTVSRREGAPSPREVTIVVGAQTGAGDDARDIVRRTDLAATFLFTPTSLAPLRTYTP